jgi:Transposase DDE domain
VIADASGRAIGFALAPGQAHELPLAPLLLAILCVTPVWIVADRGYASHALREFIWSLGARPAIPSKRNEAVIACPAWIYQNRNRVKRLWSRLKSGAQSQLAMRKRPRPSWACSAWPQPSTGSSSRIKFRD